MAHRIVQRTSEEFRGSASPFFTQPQAKIIKISDFITEVYEGVLSFTDKILTAPLVKNRQYYVQIKLKCKEISQYVMIYLTDEKGENRQTIGHYSIAAKSSTAIKKDQEEYALLNLVVTPFNNSSAILVQLERNKTNILISDLTVDVISYNYLEIKNLLEQGNAEVVKIGIQGPSGTLLCINQQGIRIGPSGIYEIKNSEIKVSFFGIPMTKAQLEKTFFLIDIEYTE